MTYDWKQLEIDEKIDYEIFRPRIEWMCNYLTENDKSIADFGCGLMILKDYLASDVKYYPTILGFKIKFKWRQSK